MRFPLVASLLVLFSSANCYEAVGQTAVAQEAAAATQQKSKNRQAVRLLPAAKAFLESLNDEQSQKAVLEFGSEKRVDWHFIPKPTRKGLPIMEMEESQKELAMKLMRAAISQLGYTKATTIMQLESVLRKLEGGENPEVVARRNPEKYYFTIFGTPANQNRWGLSIEGHHLSLNFVLNGNKILDSTPQFFASNPAELKEDYGPGFGKGMRVLQAEEQLGFKLVKSLGESQFEMAELPGETPSEIRGAGEPQPPTVTLPGIPASELIEEQRAILRELMEAYTKKMKPAVSQERWKAIEDAGFEKIKFSWSGATRPGIGHYYVVQGPTFVIEFINVQPDAAGNPANHIHCVWRDMMGDFDLPIAAK